MHSGCPYHRVCSEGVVADGIQVGDEHVTREVAQGQVEEGMHRAPGQQGHRLVDGVRVVQLQEPEESLPANLLGRVGEETAEHGARPGHRPGLGRSREAVVLEGEGAPARTTASPNGLLEEVLGLGQR